MGIYLKRLANPHSIFALSWGICLLLYSLKWSDLLPPLENDLFYLILSFIILFGITGLFIGKINFSPKVILPENSNYTLLLIINSLLWLMNFGYSGFPFIKGVREDDFGVPLVIVLATALNSFTAVYGFYLYLVSKKKRYIIFIIYCLFIFLLEYSRGYVLMSMTSMFFLWLNFKNPRFTFKTVFVVICGILLVSYMFGVVGNLRIDAGIAEVDKTGKFDASNYSSNSIMLVGEASDSFQRSAVPGEYFWTYLYMTSPIGNLQFNMLANSPSFFSNIVPLFVHELMFDSISKRYDAVMGTHRKHPELIVAALTVCTALAGPYLYGGWGGMVFFLAAIWIFPLLYIFFISKQPLGVIGVSTLSTIYFFLIFDNMFTITALGLQLFLPLIGSFRLKFK